LSAAACESPAQRAEKIRGLFQSHYCPDDEHVLLGVAGFQARAALKNLFSELPDAEKQLVSEGATSILWFEHPAERFLLVTDAATAERVTCAAAKQQQPAVAGAEHRSGSAGH
jgi:folate-binding Fe-S cluster repair protein YgfZ